MSEKRFIIVKSIENYYALVDKEREDIGEIILLSLHKEEQLDDIVDLLNELNDENKKLKKKNEWLKKARDKSDTFIVKKGLGAEFLEWCVENE